MRHRVRRQWQQWQDIGASDQVLRWIQEGARIAFKHNRPPPNSHNGIGMQDATPPQLTFLEGELARFVKSGARYRLLQASRTLRLQHTQVVT
eukprot:jgi/Tetstr1/459846/TSEL_005195.t1